MRYKVRYLPLYHHFLEADGEFIAPLHRYFNHKLEFTLAGGMVVHEVLFKELHLIPDDGNH